MADAFPIHRPETTAHLIDSRSYLEGTDLISYERQHTMAIQLLRGGGAHIVNESASGVSSFRIPHLAPDLAFEQFAQHDTTPSLFAMAEISV